jgi:SAM domain (Sterile alpha motif)
MFCINGLFYSLQPISQWTSTNVVEWMAALNLYRYAELFRSKDIKGVDLLSLDKDKLMVRSTIYSSLP